MNAIQTENLTKSFGDVVAVDHVSLTVQSGQIFALLGLNGAGKTTLIKMLCCLLSPTSGEAFVFEKNIAKDEQQVKSMINIAPQETAIAPNLSVMENLMLIAQIYGQNKTLASQNAASMIALFGLQNKKKVAAKKLSGGLQRRLGIAMALITSPRMIFLDEPTLGLDVVARRDLWKIIQKIKTNTTVILTTHYLDEVEHLADEVAIMKNGRVIAQGSVDQLLEQSQQTKFEEAFLFFNDKEEA